MTTGRMTDVLFSRKRSQGYPVYIMKKSMALFSFVNTCITDWKADCNATPTLLHLLPHRLAHIYMADPIMSAGRESFYTALESIVDSVGYVLFDRKTFPPQEERGSNTRFWEERQALRRGNIHWAAQSFLDLEVLEVETDWNKHESNEERRWSCWGSQKEMERNLG